MVCCCQVCAAGGVSESRMILEYCFCIKLSGGVYFWFKRGGLVRVAWLNLSFGSLNGKKGENIVDKEVDYAINTYWNMRLMLA